MLQGTTVTDVDTPPHEHENVVMPRRTSMNVSVTPQLAKFVEARVAAGRYHTASEVFREGLRLLESEEKKRDAELASLKAHLKQGAAQARQGELVDPDDVLRQIASLKRKRRRRA